MAKKAGKPECGYANTRNMTTSEAKITGLKTSVIIMHECGSGVISFWKKSKNGGLDRVCLRGEAPQLWKKLEIFWKGGK